MTKRALLAQTRIEMVLTLRRGESLLATLVIPIGVLVFFNAVDVVETGFEHPLDFLVPGVLALAVIATGFERRYAVLKRLGTTPLSRVGLVAAKILAVVAVLVVQAAAVIGVGVALGWELTVRLVPAGALLLLGTVAFAGLGLLMAGTLRAELTLALANGLYVGFLLLGGVAVPLSRLPAALEAAAKFTPAAQLTEAVRAVVLGADVPGWALGGLAAWAVLAQLAAAARFRWEE